MAADPTLESRAETPAGAGRGLLPLRLLSKSGELLLTVCLTFVGLTAVTFVIGRVVPIDPVLAIVGDRAPDHIVEKVRIELGLHLPLYQQYWNYLGDVLRGDFGRSVLTSRPVLEDILRFFPATIELATIATMLGVACGPLLSRSPVTSPLPVTRGNLSRVRNF